MPRRRRDSNDDEVDDEVDDDDDDDEDIGEDDGGDEDDFERNDKVDSLKNTKFSSKRCDNKREQIDVSSRTSMLDDRQVYTQVIDESLTAELEPTLHESIESTINVPIRLTDDADIKDITSRLVKNPTDQRFVPCAPVMLNLFNIKQKFHPDSYMPNELRDLDASSPHELLRRKRGTIALLFDAVDEETRVDERHPLLALQVSLLREWCMLNLIDVHDVDRYFCS